MSEYGSDIVLETSVHVDHDFEIDDHGVSNIVTFLYANDVDLDEEANESRVSLEGVINGVIDFYGDIDGYQKLYSIAHEFSRLAEKMRGVAGRIENSTDAVDDLFNISND
tara:strand:- start:943 stop:1272 length:330 start_codon:yes stop_codon:yes gene_type:complete